MEYRLFDWLVLTGSYLYLKQRFPIPVYGNLFASKRLSSKATQEALILILQRGMYLKWA